MPIEKTRKDERVSAAYKSSSKPAPKSNVKRKDDTKQRHKVDSETTGRSKDKTINLPTNESTKSRAHVLSESKKATSSTRSQKQVLNSTVKLAKKTTSSKNTKPAELIRKVEKASSSNVKKGSIIVGKVSKEHKVKDIEADRNLVSTSAVNEKPKVTRQDTFELPTVTENVDQHGDDDDTSVSYEQDFEEYESDFELDEDEELTKSAHESDDVGNVVENTDVNREVGEIARRNATSDLHETPTGLLEQQVGVKEEDSPLVAEIKPKRPTTASFQNFMNFEQAEKAQKRKLVSDKIRNRGIQLLQLLTLDTMNFNMFEMKPVKYSIFMLAFGGMNKVQVSCQTELDGSEAEAQTDEIKVLEKWSQHPADCTNACGGQLLDNDDGIIKQLESGRLLKFLRIVSKTVEILLDEELMRYSSGRNSRGSQSNLEVCNSILRLIPPDFMKGSSVIWVHSDASNPFVILSAHKALPEPLVGHGAVCVWDLLQPIKPKRILICAACPTRCCLSSHTLTAVVAGNVDGSLVMWDLKDTTTDYIIACSDVPLYCPTYSTAGINGHQSPIVSVECLTAKHNHAEVKHDGPTQIASLDESALFIVWVIVEAGGSDDVRLAPGGHLILVPSATVELNSLINPSANMRVFGFEVHPKERNNFFVTTDLGIVVNFKLNGGKVKQYKHSPDVPVEVTTVSLLGSDQRRTCFLAGCNDGIVRLHAADSERPIISWTKAANGAPIKTVMWSSCGPNIFFILDTRGEIHVWDLTYSDVHPCFSSDSKIARYECAVIGNDPRGLGKEKRNFDPYLALGTSEGIVEVHYLKENYSRWGKEEVDLFNFYLDIL